MLLPPAPGPVPQKKGSVTKLPSQLEKDTYAAPGFILHKTCADIAMLQAKFYREAGNASPALPASATSSGARSDIPGTKKRGLPKGRPPISCLLRN